MERKRKNNLLLILSILYAAAACTVFAVEFMARHHISEAIHWIADRPVFYILNVVIAFGVLAAWVAITGRMIFGIIVGGLVFMLLGIINMLKLAILQAPLFAWDFLYIKQMTALAASATSEKSMLIIGSCVFSAAVLLVIFFYFNKSRLSMRTRLLLFIMAVITIGLFSRDAVIPSQWFQINNINWDQRQNYEIHGAFLAFSMNISPLLFSQPQEYDQELVCRLVEHNNQLEGKWGFEGQAISLVFFMSESFSDLAEPLLESMDDPLKNLKQLARRYPCFHLVSPTYAGNTSLVEFEVLTGLSNAFLPSGAIPFDHYLKKPTPSIAWVLQEHGYHTIAVHPFYEWFWSRNIVYPNLGFQEYISIRHFDESVKRGFYISDEALVDKIIEVIESAPGPYFVHAVSMENHGPYFPNRYDSVDMSIKENLSEGLKTELATYVIGLRDADTQLMRLLKYLKKRQEPVICLFFGDHQPSFGLALCQELGLYKDGIERDYQMSIVPGLLWANRKNLIDPKDIPKQLSPVYLPAIVLHQMGIPLPGYMFYLQHGISCYPVVHRNFIMDSSGNLIKFHERRQDPYLRGLEVLNYDVLFGSRFSWQL